MTRLARHAAGPRRHRPGRVALAFLVACVLPVVACTATVLTRQALAVLLAP